MSLTYEMDVMDRFNFEDGRTVFAGPATGNPRIIPPCDCELFVEGESLATFWIEGEMMVEKRRAMTSRAVSTSEKLRVMDKPFVSGQWKIRFKC
jgi:hypothetical protein